MSNELGTEAYPITALANHIGITSESLLSDIRNFEKQEKYDMAFEALLKDAAARTYFNRVYVGLPLGTPIRQVESDVSEENLRRLQERIQETWGALGDSDPYWSVLSDDSFKGEQFEENLTRFYETGEREIQAIMDAVARLGLNVTPGTCLEYGCGVGRLTKALAQRFEHVHAYDISKSHLARAQEHLRLTGTDNVEFHLVEDPFATYPTGIDYYHSVLVFQHNPPPIIKRLVANALACLKPGGIGVFQLLTWRRGYKFVCDDYMASPPEGSVIEMHALPQQVVLDAIDAHGCRLLEVREMVPHLRNRILSNIFFVQKRE